MDDSEQKIKEASQGQQTKNVGVEQGDSKTSQHAESYLQIMKHYSDMLPQYFSKTFPSVLEEEGVQFSTENPFLSDISLTIKATSTNKEVVVLDAKWGQFRMDIRILNIAQDNFKHQDKLDSGAFSNIYAGTFWQKKIAIKCLPVRFKSSRRNAIKEWFLLKLASLVEVGPKVLPLFGFDLLFYKGCVDFAMELCKRHGETAVNLRNLYWNLAVIHSLHLVHCDIKPENIMLSPSHCKPVFIDFGLSFFIPENVGEKSLTSFVGSINFCSDEMGRLIFTDNLCRVDLYHNDLCCLKRCMKIYDESFEEAEKEENLTKLPSFDYLNLYLLKFLLYSKETQGFFLLWNKLDCSCQSACRKQILMFLQELIPTRELKQFLQKFVSKSDTDTDQYLMIKIAFEKSSENLFSSIFLRNEDKLTYCSSLIQEFIPQNSWNQEEIRRKDISVFQFLVHKQKITRTPYLQYIELYLNYINYINNRHRTTSISRIQVAKVYYSLFISPTVPPELTGRKIVESTIRHILEFCLQSQQIKEDIDWFILIPFKLYDFMAILDMGTAQEYINWVKQILLILERSEYFDLFLVHVDLSNYLNMYRKIKKGETFRVDFAGMLNKVVIDNKDLKKICVTERISSRIKKRRSFERQIAEQFNDKRIPFVKFLYNHQTKETEHEIIEESCMQLFNQINSQSERPRFAYFMIFLFKNYYKKNSNKYCDKIYRIFEQNVADAELLSEFCFDFYINTAVKLFTLDNLRIKRDAHTALCELLDSAEGPDILFFSNIVITYYNLIKMDSINKPEQEQLQISQKLMERFIQERFNLFQRQVFNQKSHICTSNTAIFAIVSLSKELRFKEEEIKKTLLPGKVQQIKCPQCPSIISMNISLLKIHDCLGSYCTSKSLMEARLPFLDIMFAQIEALKGVGKGQKLEYHWKKCYEKALQFGQIVCCLHADLQSRYHGIVEFYQYALKYPQINLYFKNDIKLTFPLFFTLKILKPTGRNPEFILLLAQHLQKTLLYQDYCIVSLRCLQYLGDCSLEEATNCFHRLKQLHTAQQKRTPYLSVIYALFLTSKKGVHFQSPLKAQILNMVERLHFGFQRHLLIRLYSYVCDTIKDQPLHRRQWRFCNNRLVKQYMIEQATTSNPPKKAISNNFREMLRRKAKKIGSIGNDIKFRIK